MRMTTKPIIFACIGKAHRQNEYFTNGYNSPFALTDRYNSMFIELIIG